MVGLDSLVSIADAPAALSVASDLSASLSEIFSRRSFTWSKWQSRSFQPFLQGRNGIVRRAVGVADQGVIGVVA